MSKVDWSKAPEDAEIYAFQDFIRIVDGIVLRFVDGRWEYSPLKLSDIYGHPDAERRPSIYHIVESNEMVQSDESLISAGAFLKEGLKILGQRGKQYDPSGNKERSFKQVAEAFNAITGKELKGSDVCLVLAVLKLVRQNAASEFHEDSAIDGINYLALYAEELLGEQK